MNAQEMHYDFKQKLNKLDSQKYADLIVPEIDWKLNEAQEVFIKIIAEPRLKSQLGFESNQRTIDDIRTVVVNQTPQADNCTEAHPYDDTSYLSSLPGNYAYYIGGIVYATKGSCSLVRLSPKIVRHDSQHELSPFDRSSFEWRIANVRFIEGGLRIFTDGTFTINHICLDYIKKPRRIYNAEDYVGGTYITTDGVTLTGRQSCELPDMVHREIVDLAVLITAGDLSLPGYTIKQNKIKLTT